MSVTQPRKPLRRKPLRRESARRRAERSQRREVVEGATRIGVCLAVPLGGCHGGLVGHEIVKRSQKRGAHLDPDLVISLCAGHNNWVEDHPTEARHAGLSIPRWAYDMYGEKALKEAARLRARLWVRMGSPLPFWEEDA